MNNYLFPQRSFTAFLIACDKGLVGSMTKIMQILGVGVTQDKDSKGGSPLWVAAASNSLEVSGFDNRKQFCSSCSTAPV